MARRNDIGNSAAQRRSRKRGFQHAASTARKAVDAIVGKQGFAEADVLLRWDEIAGADLSAVCQPVKVRYGSDRAIGATLIVQTNSARAPEVEHKGPQIVERVNQFYGYRAVGRLKVTQSTGLARPRQPQAGFAETQTPFEGPPRADAGTATTPTTDDHRSAAALTTSIESPGLRAALTRMGANVLANSRRDGSDETT